MTFSKFKYKEWKKYNTVERNGLSFSSGFYLFCALLGQDK